jgi:glycosyltransferase involved in cell wall biosynthesis
LKVIIEKMPEKSAKQIVFVNQSSGYLMIDIVHAFEGLYKDRVLITGFLNPRNRPLDPDVVVGKIIAYDRSSAFKRLFTWTWGFLKSLWLIKTKYRKADLFLVSNPPFAPLIPLFSSNPFKILIYDIYPDALVEFGFFRKSFWIIRLWENANRRVFSRAHKVYTLTEEMKHRVGKYVASNKIKVVPIWTDNDFLKPLPKSENPFVKEMGWENKFVVMYSGNLGKSHPVEIMVDLARQCQEPDIRFVIIGGGDKYQMLKQLIEDSRLANIQLLPWQATEKLPFTMTAADLALVTIGEEAAELSIPSKTFNLMSAGVPIISVCPKNSALEKMIDSGRLGRNFQRSELNEMLAFILTIKKEELLRKQLVQNTLKYTMNFTSENAKMFVDVVF